MAIGGSAVNKILSAAGRGPQAACRSSWRSRAKKPSRQASPLRAQIQWSPLRRLEKKLSCYTVI